MMVACRLELNGQIYIDKTFFERFNESDLEVYGYKSIDAPADCVASDFNNDLTFSYDKYNQRKEKQRVEEYESLIVNKIRQKYSLDQELAILRQRDTKPSEFYEYNNYVELCKAEVKAKFNL